MVCLINKQDTKVLFLAKIFSLSVRKKKSIQNLTWFAFSATLLS